MPALAHITTFDWTALRGLVDWLWLHPDEVDATIAEAPRPTGDPVFDNLRAALAEKLADDAGRPRPPWTWDVPPLPHPWRPPGTPRMQAVEVATAAPQFVDRGLLIGVANLWRLRDFRDGG